MPHSRKCRLFHVNAFTRSRFCGNPAAVVLDAEVLTQDEMRRIARELAGTEVAFVLPSDSADYDVAIRFFSPRREVGFVGHATVAAHYVRALVHGVPKGKVRQKTQSGVVEVEVTGKAPDELRVTFELSPATFGPVVPEERLGPVLDALGISSASLHPACPVQVMSRVNSRLLIGLQSPDTLASLQPRMDSLVHLTPHVGADGFFVFAVNPGLPLTTESRMFCPVIGVPEDPVSGNAHGMLGVYLLNNGLLQAEDGIASFVGHQGKYVDRPGQVEVAVAASGKRATGVRVTGDAVVVYEAALPL